MPAVKKGEKRNDYVKRCVSEVMKEGKTQKQSVGKCEGMFTGKYGQKKK
jgi:hypothetical protein